MEYTLHVVIDGVPVFLFMETEEDEPLFLADVYNTVGDALGGGLEAAAHVSVVVERNGIGVYAFEFKKLAGADDALREWGKH